MDFAAAETFALAVNRDEALKKLPSSTEAKYYRALHLQTTKGAAATKEFKELMKQLSLDYNKRNLLELRQNLLEFDQHHADPVKEEQNRVWEFIRNAQQPKPNLEHPIPYNPSAATSTTSEGGKDLPPTELDQKKILIKHIGKSLLDNDKYSLHKFEQLSAHWLAKQSLHKEQKPLFWRSYLTADLPNIASHLSQSYEHNKTPPTCQNFTLQQLDELRKQHGSILDYSAFWTGYINKLKPKGYAKWSDILKMEDRLAYVQQLYGFVNKLGPSGASLKWTTLYHLLRLNLEQNKYDEDLFTTYLMIPKRANYYNEDITHQKSWNHIPYESDCGILPRVSLDKDLELVCTHLHHFFEKNGTYKPYQKYFHESFIKKEYGKFLLWKGEQVPTELAPFVDLTSVNSEVLLEFASSHRTHFLPGDPIDIDIYVKNVPRLLIKVFEINTVGYYQETMKEIDTDINLDGLIANEE
eukprot:TRINITY_DN6390_c0_g1_i1.p1 TRINITY_DN6390_c0_g1~~TRINITY_DN6390_c0_g1_i1.p1  ORF type:complete len:468 (+),score=127.76 TRINITY_DN6390_c0_g1_i1:89-1492(+)